MSTNVRSRRISLRQRWAMCRYAALLTAFHALRRILPFRAFSRFVGQPMKVSLPVSAQSHVKMARVICAQLDCVAGKLALNLTCLDKAVAARFALQRQGIIPVIYFGVKPADAGRPGLDAAHAWLSVGGEVLLGGEGHEDYTPLESFV